mmetsp:Transcript_4510/g.6884  ORF Transcript_4510/g.6884 Transcript_4510/m.6884 type:complete len:214 (+) Transcript_4510:394-1035(+)
MVSGQYKFSFRGFGETNHHHHLIITILFKCLCNFFDCKPTSSTLHTCDNQALVKRVNNIRDNNNFHTLNDPIDADIIVPTAYWADHTLLKSKWVRGHAKCWKIDTAEWTDEEWANNIADTYADRDWHTTRAFTVPELPSPSFTISPYKYKILAAACLENCTPPCQQHQHLARSPTASKSSPAGRRHIRPHQLAVFWPSIQQIYQDNLQPIPPL